MRIFRLITLALHFSPFNQGRLDATILDMLREELNPEDQALATADNIIELQTTLENPETREAA